MVADATNLILVFTEWKMDSPKMIGRNLSAIVRLTHNHLNKDLEKIGLSSGQYPFFLALIKHEGATQEEVTEILSMDKATTARAIKKLVDMGFVKRLNCSKDHRCYKLYITEKGYRIIPDLMKILNDWQGKMFEGFSNEEVDQFSTLLFKTYQNIKGNGK